MLAPIALGAARALSADGKADLALGGALMLGVAHAATIGGIGTPVGTPTNLIGIAFFERAGETIAFIDWMAMALPIMLLMMPLAWLFLCLPLFGKGADAMRRHWRRRSRSARRRSARSRARNCASALCSACGARVDDAHRAEAARAVSRRLE